MIKKEVIFEGTPKNWGTAKGTGDWLRCCCFRSLLFCVRTVSLLLDGLGLGHGETLHGLVFLRLRLVLVRVVLVLAVGVDQHSAVERVAVPPGTLAGPRDAVHCAGTRGRGSLRTRRLDRIPPLRKY